MFDYCPSCGFYLDTTDRSDKTFYVENHEPLTGTRINCHNCENRTFVTSLKVPTIKEMLRHLEDGKVIQAIKMFREETGLGLKDSKDIVDIIKSKCYPSKLDTSKLDSKTYVDCTPQCNVVYGQHTEICKAARKVV